MGIGGVVAGLGVGTMVEIARGKGKEFSGEVPAIRSYVELGRTGLKISDSLPFISLLS